MSNSLRTFVYEKFTDLSNLISNPLAVSQFMQEGTLTPEEVRLFKFTNNALYNIAHSLLVCSSW